MRVLTEYSLISEAGTLLCTCTAGGSTTLAGFDYLVGAITYVANGGSKDLVSGIRRFIRY